MIQFEHVTKDFNTTRALEDFSFRVQPGEVFGLLGPNGAGKTTTIRILNGLVAATSGRVSVFGLDPLKDGDRIRSRAGVLTETPSLYERLSAEQNLQFFAKLNSIPQQKRSQRVFEMLEMFDLSDRAREPVGGFSKGMKQRLALARSLLHEPELLYLDEPTASLDPESALQVNQLVNRISHDKGSTVLLCTHNLVEAQRLCDRVAVMDRGRLLGLGTPADLASSLFPFSRVEVEFANHPGDINSLVKGLDFIREFSQSDNRLTASLISAGFTPDLVRVLVQAGARIVRVTPLEVSLEEIYFTLQHKNGGQQ